MYAAGVFVVVARNVSESQMEWKDIYTLLAEFMIFSPLWPRIHCRSYSQNDGKEIFSATINHASHRCANFPNPENWKFWNGNNIYRTTATATKYLIKGDKTIATYIFSILNLPTLIPCTLGQYHPFVEHFRYSHFFFFFIFPAVRRMKIHRRPRTQNCVGIRFYSKSNKISFISSSILGRFRISHWRVYIWWACVRCHSRRVAEAVERSHMPARVLHMYI